MTKLIIAEKPSMGRTRASAVGATNRHDGYIEGNGYIVSWCFGHLYELQTLDAYIDPDWYEGKKSNWKESFFSLPYFPADWQFKYVSKTNCTDQIKKGRSLLILSLKRT